MHFNQLGRREFITLFGGVAMLATVLVSSASRADDVPWHFGWTEGMP